MSGDLQPTDWVSGLLSGFTRRKGEIEAQNTRESELARDRESRVYQTLINSPDPEIQAAAVMGLMESAKPGRRKGGFAGWVGEMQANPAYAQVQALMGTPTQAQETTYAPTIGTPQAQLPTVPTGSLSLPETSPTEVGAPPPNPVTPGNYPGVPVVEPKSPPLKATTKTVSKPRRVFPTAQDLATQQAAGQYGGRVEGVLTALRNQGVDVTPELAQQIGLELSGFSSGSGGVGGAPFQAIAGTMPDGTPISGVFDRARGKYIHPVTGEILEGFVARQTSASATRFGQTREAISRELYGKDFRELDQPQVQAVMAREREEQQAAASRRALGTEQGQYNAPVDAPTAQRTGMPVGASAAQVEGQRIGTQPQQQRRLAAGDIRTQLDHIKTLLPAALPSKADLSGLLPGATVALRKRSPQYRDAFAQLEAAINNIRASLTRTMQSNVGTETERDAERAMSTLADIQGRLLDPASGDTVESATLRINETIRYLDEVMRSVPGAPVLTAPPVGVGAPPPGQATVTQPGVPPPAPSAVAAPPRAPVRAGAASAGPAGYTVNDQGQLLLNGKPVQ